MLAQEALAPLNDRQRKLVAAACEGTDRLHRIIETLLRLHRIEEGQQPLQLEPVAAESIVTQAASALGEDFARRGLTLQTALPAGLPRVRADRELIGYVLTNLLSNALKFVPSGGEVVVTAMANADQVVFTVRDNGPGIAEEHIPHLFTRFYRAGAPAGVSGVGLGLAIARQLVQAHGGTIHYAPQQPTGAGFVFTLQAAS